MLRNAALALLSACCCFGQATIRLNLDQARALALKNHPQVLASQADFQRAEQQVTAAKSAYYPTISGEVTGSQANENARIGAGYFTDSRLFNRVGYGVVLSQLITDSGRTPSLVASSRLGAQASQENLRASRFDVLLRVDRAYYDVLLAQGLVKVAQQTVQSRQTVADQIAELARNKLKSQVDVSFTQVNLSEAKLMLIRAQSRLTSAFAALSEALGTSEASSYELADEPMPSAPVDNPEMLVTQAIRQRPEIAAAHLEVDSNAKFAQAERDLKRPTLSLTGVAGSIPWIDPANANPQIAYGYEGLAMNLHIPVFNGHLFSAREQAARYQVVAAQQRERDLEDCIGRDVRTAWADAKTNYEALSATAQLLEEAKMALDLAEGRYHLGLSSVVELSQAQLGETQAEIENLNARYQYEASYSALQYTIGSLR